MKHETRALVTVPISDLLEVSSNQNFGPIDLGKNNSDELGIRADRLLAVVSPASVFDR